MTKEITDRQRLDWLVANTAYINFSQDGQSCRVLFMYFGDGIQRSQRESYQSARGAIDAAMTKVES